MNSTKIPIIYLIGKRLSDMAVGLAAAVFLAFSPFNIYYAQEARMYTLLAFNAAVAIYALVRLLTDPCASMPVGSQFREYGHTWRTAGPVEPDDRGEFRYKVDPPGSVIFTGARFDCTELPEVNCDNMACSGYQEHTLY